MDYKLSEQQALPLRFRDLKPRELFQRQFYDGVRGNHYWCKSVYMKTMRIARTKINAVTLLKGSLSEVDDSTYVRRVRTVVAPEFEVGEGMKEVFAVAVPAEDSEECEE